MEVLREFKKHKPVQVYRNLHKKCWSIRQGGKVVAHTKTLRLSSCTFHVQPAGHKKVLKEQRKNVHAYIKGYLVDKGDKRSILESFYYFIKEHKKHKNTDHRVSYNPYKYDYFYNVKTQEKIDKKLDYILMDSDGEVWFL